MLERFRKFEIKTLKLIIGGEETHRVCNSDGSMTVYFSSGGSVTYWPE